MSAPRIATGAIVAGKYSVGTCLGYGGSSATYHAAAVGGREVAVKMFDPALRQRPEAMAQLEKVYAAINGLPHDSTLPILDAGYDQATGSAFSVTERVPHPSVAQFIAQRTMTPDEAAAMLVSVARAIDAAHQRKLCHHALKPTNVFVRTNDLGGIVADFGAGIVRTAAPSQEGYALSAPWLAPEQAQSAQPGVPADIFALTLLAFYALTGKSYWLACQGAQPDYAGWQREILSPRTPPSARAQQLGVSLPVAFDAVLARGVAIDPRERFPSAGDLGRAIEQLVRGQPSEVQPGRAESATQAFPVSHLMPDPQQLHQQLQQQQLQQQQQQQPPMQQGPMMIGGPAQAPPQGPQATANDLGVGSYSGTVNATALDTTGLQNVEAPRAPATTKLAPVFVGVVVVLLLGGAVAAYVALGRPKPVIAATSASAIASSVPSSEAASTEPSSSAAAADPSATPSSDADASAGPTGKLALSCDPSCDAIGVDDQPLTDPVAVDLPAGKHKISLGKDGYTSQTDAITIEVGKTFTKKYKLAKTADAAANVPSNPSPHPVNNNPAPQNGKKCGKFLERCK